jgi:hypothetical protein
MKTSVKAGVIAGVIGLFFNICISTFMGICGPGTALIAGACAGFFAGQKMPPAASRKDGAQAGVISGLIAGGFTLLGQLIASILVLVFAQFTQLKTFFGNIPTTADGTQSVIYYVSGLGMATCFGLAGIVLSALAGAATGYLGVKSTDFLPPPLPEEVEKKG